jgi:putative nucleotidyltransferase with HDIG domain
MSVSIETAERHHTHREVIVEAEVWALLTIVEAHDGYTGEHSKAVMGLAAEVACEMGLPEEEMVVVRHVALLHDVGKVYMPDRILKKQGSLEDGEREVMQEHVEVGARMVASVKGVAHLAPLVRASHERWDGKGYPDGLSGEEIPLASRIVHACDAWHAMTSDRPYREALGVEKWIRELEENMGKQFDPRVVLALVDVLKTRYLLPPDRIERTIGETLCVA